MRYTAGYTLRAATEMTRRTPRLGSTFWWSSEVQDWEVQVAALRLGGDKTTSEGRTSMKMRFILPLMASVALAIPAFAQTSPQPATPEPAMQDQSTPAPMAKHMKAKTKGHKKMAKGKHAKAKPEAPDKAAPQ